ncbi:PAS domain S-box protein [Bdellovibrionota bacterium FG-1]
MLMAAGVAFLGFIGTVGYLYDEPPLYGGQLTPIAQPVTLLFSLLGISVFILESRESRAFLRLHHPVELLLVKSFVPPSCLAMLIMGWFANKLHSQQPHPNFSLIFSVVSIVIMTIAALHIIMVSRRIGHRLEVAQEQSNQSALALKESEARFRNVVENSLVGVWQIDSNYKTVYVNQPMAEMLGTHANETIGHTPLEWVYEGDRADLVTRLKNRKHKKKETYEFRLHRRDTGALLHIAISASPLLDEKGEFMGSFAMVTDTTALKNTQAALHQYVNAVVDSQETERRRVAQELHEGVIQLLGVTLHRLRAPVGAVSRHTAEELLTRAIDEIRRITYRLRPFVLDDLGLATAIQSLCADFEERTQKSLNIRLGKMPERLGDKEELAIFRITQEVLNNIEKHSEATKVVLELQVESSVARLNISDNGTGFIAAEQNSKLVTGLGLHHIKERAIAVGGSAFIDSTPGKGTHISVSIPV